MMSSLGSHLGWRDTGPPFEGRCEGRDLLKAETPGNLRDREARILEIVPCQVRSHPVKDLAEGQVLFCQSPRQGPPAHAEGLRDAAHPHFSLWQERGDRILHAGLERACGRAPLGEDILAVADENLVQVGLCIPQPALGGSARERDLVCPSRKDDRTAEILLESGRKRRIADGRRRSGLA